MIIRDRRAIILSVGILVVIAVVVIVGYFASLVLHPYGPTCKRCKGTGIQRGSIWRYSTRTCTKCGGSPRRGRAGLNTFFSNEMVWGERKAREVAAQRARRYGR